MAPQVNTSAITAKAHGRGIDSRSQESRSQEVKIQEVKNEEVRGRKKHRPSPPVIARYEAIANCTGRTCIAPRLPCDCFVPRNDDFYHLSTLALPAAGLYAASPRLASAQMPYPRCGLFAAIPNAACARRPSVTLCPPSPKTVGQSPSLPTFFK